MNVRPEDNSTTRFWVTSESDGDTEYLVEAAQFKLGLNSHGVMKFNGACIGTKSPEEWLEVGCKDFLYRCEPKLKKPENAGKVYRCKHCRAVREYLDGFALDGFIARLAALNPNIPDEHQT